MKLDLYFRNRVSRSRRSANGRRKKTSVRTSLAKSRVRQKIGESWKIPADLLVRPYKVEKAA
jgi:hypothetical protein